MEIALIIISCIATVMLGILCATLETFMILTFFVMLVLIANEIL